MNSFKPLKIMENKNNSIDSSKLSDIDISYMEKNIFRFKLILVGEFFVGKTAIITRYINDNFLGSGIYECTLGVEFKIKSLMIDNNTEIDLQIWDTCGHERYKTVTKQYFRDKSGKKIK
jgi:GTPase SAR1 family protein